MAQLPHTNKISQASTLSQQNNIITSSYGDGYSQWAEWGTNSQADKWSLSWKALTETERNDLYNFFKANGLFQAWQWTDPITLVEKQWRFTTPLTTNVVAGVYDISASIIQDFRLA